MKEEKLVQNWVTSVSNDMKGEMPDDRYDVAVNFVRDQFNKSCQALYNMSPSYRFGVVSMGKGKDTLFDMFLGCLPENVRQHYNCHTCRQFINKYGRLVAIHADGTLASVMWNNPPHELNLGMFSDAISLLKNKVEHGRVIYLFGDHCSREMVLGKEMNGGYRHFHAGPLGNAFYAIHLHGEFGDFINLHQTNYKLLKSFLEKYANERGLGILKSIRDGFEYGVLSEYKKFHDTLDDLGHVLEYNWGNLDTTPSNNKIWYHVMHNDSFVKVKNSVLGMLFDDLDSGMDFDTAAERFNNAVDPLHYRRPQSLPSVNQVAEAQKLIDQMGLEPSFHRRHAFVNEIPLLWKPSDVEEEPEKTEESSTGGLFSNVPTSDKGSYRRMKPTIDTPSQDKAIKITWAKFQRDVLPDVVSMVIRLRDRQRYPFTTILTATNPDAKPILKYDKEDDRCPFSGYMRRDGATPEEYGLTVNKDIYYGFSTIKEFNITGLCSTPYEWANNPDALKMTKGIIALIEGASDYPNSKVALFPEILIPELYPYRKVIESYSSNTAVDYDERYGVDEMACGIYLVNEENSLGLPIKVTKKDRTTVSYEFIAYE